MEKQSTKRMKTTRKKISLNGIPPNKIRRIQTQNRIRATVTGTRAFDRSLHKTNLWLKEVMEHMHWDNRERAYSAMRATLHALRDLLFLEESVQFGAQLPLLMRGVYYDGWNPNLQPFRLKNISEFYQLVQIKLGAARLKYSNDDIRKMARVCMEIICDHVDSGEMRDVRGVLPKRLQGLVTVSWNGKGGVRRRGGYISREAV